ncbi:MAG: hypothetical protein ABR962_07780 [Candidatus Bathyarchaeia archaeon]|jgi:hypothetical protein
MSILSINRLRRLSLGFPTLDDFFQGFELGDFVVIRGNAASFMSFVLSVQTQLPIERGGLSSRTVFVDGGNMFSPYSVAEIARERGVDSKTALEKVYVSRAFTAHQLSSLVLEKLCLVLRKIRARLLIVSDISSLFLDRDVPKAEAEELFIKTCSKLSEIASEKQAIAVVTYLPRERSRMELFFEAVLFGKSTVLIRLRRKGQIFTFALEDHPSIKSFIRNFTIEQAPLNCVHGGAGFGKDRSIL